MSIEDKLKEKILAAKNSIQKNESEYFDYDRVFEEAEDRRTIQVPDITKKDIVDTKGKNYYEKLELITRLPDILDYDSAVICNNIIEYLNSSDAVWNLDLIKEKNGKDIERIKGYIQEIESECLDENGVKLRYAFLEMPISKKMNGLARLLDYLGKPESYNLRNKGYVLLGEGNNDLKNLANEFDPLGRMFNRIKQRWDEL